jgi:hypothetical protein
MQAKRYGDVIEICEFGLDFVNDDIFKITRILELLLLASIEKGERQLQKAITKIFSFAKRLSAVPNYTLLFADCYSYINKEIAISLYKEFLEQGYSMQDLGGYFNNLRHIQHPLLMIQKLTLI